MPGEPGAPHLSLIAAERARERKLPQTRFARAGGGWGGREGLGPGRAGEGVRRGHGPDPLSHVGFAHRSSGSLGFPKGVRVCRRRLCGSPSGAISPTIWLMRMLGKSPMEPGKRPNLFPRRDRVPALRGGAGEGSAGAEGWLRPTSPLPHP